MGVGEWVEVPVSMSVCLCEIKSKFYSIFVYSKSD